MTRTRTIADLMAELQNDPEWVEQDRERNARHRSLVEKNLAEMRPEMEPLVIALREAGFEFDTLSDFVNTDDGFPGAIPIFLKHLQTATHPTLRTIIGRSLAGPEARGLAGPVLIRELKEKADNKDVRWVLANALAYAASKEDVEELRELLDDPRNDDVRERIEAAIKKVPKR